MAAGVNDLSMKAKKEITKLSILRGSLGIERIP
jgi:hypothetical protein